MKKNLFLSLMLIALSMSFVCLSSCSDDDDDDQKVSFTQEKVVGTWEIKSVSNSEFNWMKTGSTAQFNSDGTCSTGFSMEDIYTIKGGKIHTFCSDNDEPMFVYTLQSESDNIITVKMTGTLDDNRSCTFTAQRIN